MTLTADELETVKAALRIRVIYCKDEEAENPDGPWDADYFRRQKAKAEELLKRLEAGE